MARNRGDSPRHTPEVRAHEPGRRAVAAALADPANRGIVLDVLVIVLNVLLMPRMAAEFIRLGNRASSGDAGAKVALTLFFVGMLVLPAAGAVLKRWHFHQRPGSARRAERMEEGALGCLLHPVVYLCVSLTVGMTAAVLVAQQALGDDFIERGDVFVPMILGVLVLGIVQTALVYRYFSAPRQPPRGAFWRGRASAVLGDACIFTNMILFQVLWNIALSARFTPPADAQGIAGRLFFLCFVAILIYLPPRIFYLADDLRRPAGRVSVLLATSSGVVRQMLGG